MHSLFHAESSKSHMYFTLKAQLGSQCGLAPFQVFSSHTWQVATIPKSRVLDSLFQDSEIWGPQVDLSQLKASAEHPSRAALFLALYFQPVAVCKCVSSCGLPPWAFRLCLWAVGAELEALADIPDAQECRGKGTVFVGPNCPPRNQPANWSAKDPSLLTPVLPALASSFFQVSTEAGVDL